MDRVAQLGEKKNCRFTYRLIKQHKKNHQFISLNLPYIPMDPMAQYSGGSDPNTNMFFTYIYSKNINHQVLFYEWFPKKCLFFLVVLPSGKLTACP